MNGRRTNPSLAEALQHKITPAQFVAEHPYRVEGPRWKLGIRWIEEYRIVHCSCLKTAEDVAAKTGMAIVEQQMRRTVLGPDKIRAFMDGWGDETETGRAGRLV